jgi:hypothetical protein
MTASEENPSYNPGNRWYDNDPALHKAMEQLRLAPDNYQAQVALNIIKIIVEHQAERDNIDSDSTEILNTALPRQRSWNQHREHRRWYDVQETLSSAIQLLVDSPEDLQKSLIPSIAQMIENTLNNSQD